jgi:hypothetical protein
MFTSRYFLVVRDASVHDFPLSRLHAFAMNLHESCGLRAWSASLCAQHAVSLLLETMEYVGRML